MAMPPFHFGSHYSVAGFVLWFLVRLEPFTSLHVQLQDGKFDRADRLFASIGNAWKGHISAVYAIHSSSNQIILLVMTILMEVILSGSISNPSDVKELIPEFFYLAEAFRNTNSIDFGSSEIANTILTIHRV
jgi:hypothetical protein